MSSFSAFHRSHGLVQRFVTREASKSLRNGSVPPSSSQPTPSLLNPFLPRLNPATGRWAPPQYSARRQAELVKAAKVIGTTHLLPPGLKYPKRSSETKLAKHTQSRTKRLLRVLESNKETSDPQSTPLKRSVMDTTAPEETITWIGAPKAKASFGLYGKRRKMFKGRRWEREVKLRKEAAEKVVRGMPKQRKDMDWGRLRRSRRPHKNYPI